MGKRELSDKEGVSRYPVRRERCLVCGEEDFIYSEGGRRPEGICGSCFRSVGGRREYYRRRGYENTNRA